MDTSLLTTLLELDRRKTERNCREHNQRAIRAILEDTGAITLFQSCAFTDEDIRQMLDECITSQLSTRSGRPDDDTFFRRVARTLSRSELEAIKKNICVRLALVNEELDRNCSPPECPMSNDSMCSQAATTVSSPILAHSEPLSVRVPSGAEASRVKSERAPWGARLFAFARSASRSKLSLLSSLLPLSLLSLSLSLSERKSSHVHFWLDPVARIVVCTFTFLWSFGALFFATYLLLAELQMAANGRRTARGPGRTWREARVQPAQPSIAAAALACFPPVWSRTG